MSEGAPSPQVDLSGLEKLLTDIRWELQQQRRYYGEIVRHQQAGATLEEVTDFTSEHVLSFRQTMEHLISTGDSFARYGDGELKTMLRFEYNLGFQPNSLPLRTALLEIFTTPLDKLLIGFPHVHRDLHWTSVWSDIWPSLTKIIPSGVTFGKTHVTRPIYFQFMGDEGVALWRQVWAGQRVCVITGKDSRFELVDALFDNVKSVQRIHSTPTDAFSDLARLVPEVIAHSTADLHLVALGPAGTILSHELTRRGRRALDMGHISDSYKHAFEGGQWPEAKPYKR